MLVDQVHMLKVALDSMRYNCVMLRVMGGQDHHNAALTIESLTGKAYRLPQGCVCNAPR